MKKSIEAIMEGYMYKTTIDQNSDNVHLESYILGYLDGYFLEQIYRDIILDTENSYILKEYFRGTTVGYNDRYNMDSINDVKAEKLSWIKKLALHDELNAITERPFDDESLLVYNDYRNNGVVDLNSLKFKTVRR